MFQTPYALLALLALPILVWLHRRRLQGALVDVPSLLFLDPEPAEATAPQRRRFDAELALALAAAGCLALAAAGPPAAVGAPKPVVRVVLDASPAMEAKAIPTSKSPREQAEAVLAALGLTDSIVRARGKPTDLLAAARREKADVRIVVSDRAINPSPPDVHVAAYGDPPAENAGIIAASVAERQDGSHLLVTVWNHSPRERACRLTALDWVPEGDPPVGGEKRDAVLRIPADSARSQQLPLGMRAARVEVRVGEDALRADDLILLEARPLRVEFSERVPAVHREAVREVLHAVLGERGVEEIPAGKSPPPGMGASPRDLLVDTTDAPRRDTGRTVWIEVLRPGEPAVPVESRAAEPDDVLAGVDASGAECLGRTRGPLVAAVRSRRTSLAYVWRADPLAGTPAPADTPAWPVFWANLLDHLRGGDVGAGWRATGVLDPDVTRLGRDRIPIDPAWIANATTPPPPPRDLRLPLIAGGTACLLLLWFAPRGGRSATVG